MTGNCSRAGSCSCSTHYSWKEQPGQLQVLLRLRGDQAELMPLRTSSGWLEQDLSAGRGAEQGCAHTFLSATGHFGLFVCLFPDLSYTIPFWGTLILILACFRGYCTPSWGTAICLHAILILGPNFRTFIPIWNNARATEFNQSATWRISTVSLAITFWNLWVKY